MCTEKDTQNELMLTPHCKFFFRHDQSVSLATIISKEADNSILVRTSACVIATNVLLLKKEN